MDSRDNCKGYYIFTVRDAETNDLISAVWEGEEAQVQVPCDIRRWQLLSQTQIFTELYEFILF